MIMTAAVTVTVRWRLALVSNREELLNHQTLPSLRYPYVSLCVLLQSSLLRFMANRERTTHV